MNFLHEVIYYFLLGDKDLNNEVEIEMPNHVTILTYFSKRTRAKPVEQQLSFHTDNISNNDGTFDHKQNSQGENAVTAILTLGDSRELCFREFSSDSRD